MKKLLVATFALFLGCSIVKRSSNKELSYTMYPYWILKDTTHFSTDMTIVPVRVCDNQDDTERIYFIDLLGLKFDEYRKLSFKEFNDSIVNWIFNKRCLALKQDPHSINKLTISSREYINISADSLFAAFFKNGSYGDENVDEGIPLSKEILVAFLVLFDNKYVISRSDVGDLYFIEKAPSDDEIRANPTKGW